MVNKITGVTPERGARVNAARPHKHWCKRRWRVVGQGLVEYALILVMVAIVIILIVTFIGQTVATNMYSKINSGFPSP